MTLAPSLQDRLKRAYLEEVESRLPGRGGQPEGGRLEEGAGPYPGQGAALRQLLYRILDAALDQTRQDKVLLAEDEAGWLDPELARALGRSGEEVRAFVRAEAPRLINLRRLARLLAAERPLELPEAALLEPSEERPLLASQAGKFRELLDSLRDLADNGFSVLISGASGTGKELIARRIHELSPFAAGPFLPVDCAALPPSLMEAELFGHEKGAFTGALRSRPGKIERAAGGTLFLDEAAELSLSAQVMLLRVLQERVVERLGGGRPVKVRLRVVAASSRDIEGLVAEGQFREDLYYRLATLPVKIPPLRDRLEDLPVLMDHYLTQACLETRKVRRFSPRVRQLFLSYDYPGNVRELINLIDHAVAASRRHVIDLEDLPRSLAERLISPGLDGWSQALAGLPLKPAVRPALARLLAQRQGGYLANADLRQALDCSDSTAKTLLGRLAEAGLVAPEGSRGGRRYRVATLTPG